MVAHLDSVTSLAVDPNGLYLMSGSEYSAVRCQRQQKTIFNIQNEYVYSLSEKDQLSIQDMEGHAERSILFVDSVSVPKCVDDGLNNKKHLHVQNFIKYLHFVSNIHLDLLYSDMFSRI